MAKFKNPTKVITGVNTRWSYANVHQPKSINGGKPKYSVSLIIPKSDTVTVNKVNAAIQAKVNSKVMVNPYLLFPLSRHLSVTVTLKGPMMRPTKTRILSMPTLQLLRVL